MDRVLRVSDQMLKAINIGILTIYVVRTPPQQTEMMTATNKIIEFARGVNKILDKLIVKHDVTENELRMVLDEYEDIRDYLYVRIYLPLENYASHRM